MYHTYYPQKNHFIDRLLTIKKKKSCATRVFGTCVWKYVFCCLKIYMKIRLDEKVYENTCNVI